MGANELSQLAITKSENQPTEANCLTENADSPSGNLVSEDDSSTSSITWGNKSDVLSEVGVADLYA